MDSANIPVVAASVKQWWQSRTLWLNLIAAVLMALESHFDLLQPYLSGDVYAWFAVGLTVANAIMRVVTTQALAISGARP